MLNLLIDEYKTFKGDEVTIIKRFCGDESWYCGYVKCNQQVEVDPDFPTQGYANNMDVMFLQQPEVDLDGWYYYWDTAHAGMENTESQLLDMMYRDLYGY